MVTQYPHRVTVWEAPEAAQDVSGKMVSGEALLQFESVCRIEISVSSRDQYIYGADGNKIVFKGIIYLPLNTNYRVKPGANVKVYEGVTKLADEKVIQFSRGQLNMRIWV